MNNQRIFSLMMIALVLASFFHIQAIVLLIVFGIIAMPLQLHFAALKSAKVFAVLIIPALISLAAGYKNDTYLIFKDLYYLFLPVLFCTAGILLACRMEIPQFLRTLVISGVIVSILVTAISFYYTGVQSLTDPYAAHYVIGIVGTPAPPMGLACLLFGYKLNIKLFPKYHSAAFVAVNCLGIYMLASRTYLIITICFLLLFAVSYLKRIWFTGLALTAICFLYIHPFSTIKNDQAESFTGKIMGSFTEISLGNYDTEQDINTRYRGYESFMALKEYTSGNATDWVFGGLGKLIDLKTFVKLGEDSELRYIPILHNGWLYLLVKTGLTGVLVYLAVFISLLVSLSKIYLKGNQPAVTLFAALLVGCILSMLVTNYIVSSFFNVEMSILMITLGYSYLNVHSLLYKQGRDKHIISGDLEGTALFNRYQTNYGI